MTLFCVCSIALLLAAISFRGAATGPSTQPAPAASLDHAPPAARVRPAPPAKLKRAAHRFLSAFLRYEVGEADHRVLRTLRATATPAFARELLAAPPQPPAHSSSPARLERLTISSIPALPPRTLISAEARGTRGREQLAFLFDLRRGVWLARGLGE